MKIRNLTNGAAVQVVVAPGAAAGSNTTITPIDMSDYESIMFILSYATGLSAANTPVLSANMGAKSDGSDAAAVSGTQTAALAAAVSFQTLELDRPSKRYIRPIVTCNGANEYWSLIAILFPAKHQAVPGETPTQFGGDPSVTATLPLVPQAATFNTTSGAFNTNMVLQNTATAGKQYAQLIANP